MVEVFRDFISTKAINIEDINIIVFINTNHHNCSVIALLSKRESKVDTCIYIKLFTLEIPITVFLFQKLLVVVLELVSVDSIRTRIVRVVVVLSVKLNSIRVFCSNSRQHSIIKSKSFSIRTDRSRPEIYTIILDSILHDFPNRLLVDYISIIIKEFVFLCSPCSINVRWMISSTTSHCKATSITNRSELRSLLTNSFTTIFCISVLRNHQIVCYYNISVPACSVSGETCCSHCRVSNAFFLTNRMVNRDFTLTPTFSKPFLRINVFREIALINCRAKNILDCKKLCLC